MKNKIIQFVGVVSMLAATGATASTVFVNPDTVNTAPGSTFTATVQADFTDVGGATWGGFLLTWDSSLLSLVSGSELVPNILTPPVITANSVDYGFATCIFCGPTDVLGATDIFDVYSLTFEVAADAGTVSTNAVLSIGAVGNLWLGADGLTDVTPGALDFHGATINISAVPVPPAVWLFGSGLLGLVGVARRRPQAVGRLASAV